MLPNERSDMAERTPAGRIDTERSENGSRGESVPRVLTWSDWMFRLLLSLGVIAMGVLIASKLAWVHPLFELTTHTLWHVGIVLLAGFVVLYCWMRFHAKRWFNEQGGKNLKFGLLMMGYCMLNGIFLAELQPWQAIPLTSIPWQAISKLDKAKVHTEAKKTAGTGEGLLRVMSWNVWLGNQSYSEVLRTIRERDPDVLVLIEVGPWHRESLGDLLKEEYPYSKWIPQNDARGIAMLSRIPGMEFLEVDLAGIGMPAIEGQVPGRGAQRGLRILGVHTSSPNLGGRTAQRDQQLDFMRRWVLESNEEALVIGDFNITPWSKPFRERLKGEGLGQGKLRDTREGRGFFATWPSGLGWLGIPIDHALVTQGIEVHRRGAGLPLRESDHGWIDVTIRTLSQSSAPTLAR